MEWTVEWTDKSKKDLKDLDGSSRKQVLQAIKKVQQNPLSQQEGGYGKPLGNKNNMDLTHVHYNEKKPCPGCRFFRRKRLSFLFYDPEV